MRLSGKAERHSLYTVNVDFQRLCSSISSIVFYCYKFLLSSGFFVARRRRHCCCCFSLHSFSHMDEIWCVRVCVRELRQNFTFRWLHYVSISTENRVCTLLHVKYRFRKNTLYVCARV